MGAEQTKKEQDAIATLSTVVRLGINRRTEYAFVGWTAGGLPAVARDSRALSAEARESVVAYQASRLNYRAVPYADLVPVEFSSAGAAVDFPDVGRTRAEDLVPLEFVGAAGTAFDVPLGELALLEAIVDAAVPWQLVPDAAQAQAAVAPRPMYTLFLPLDATRAYAVLFRPALPGESNQATFRAFVRSMISKLLVIDESQPPRNQKGYVQAAARLTAPPPHGLLSQLVALDEPTRQSLASAGRQARVDLLKTLRALALVEISDAQLEVIEHNADVYYDIGELSLEQLLKLAAQMLTAAKQAL